MSNDAGFSEQPMPPPPADVGVPPPKINKERMRYVVIDCLDAGKSHDEIRAKLMAYGYAREEADRLIEEVKFEQHRTSQYDTTVRGHAGVHLISGAGLFLFGLAATLGSLYALGAGGRVLIFSWIPMVLGAFQFYRGLARWNNW